MWRSRSGIGWLLLDNAFVAVAFFLAGLLGLRLTFPPEVASVFWPPTGIGLAAFLLLGPRCAPGIFLAAFAIHASLPGAVAASLGVAVSSTVEVALGVFLLRRGGDADDLFSRPRAFFHFVVLAGVIGTAVGATLAVGSLALFGQVSPDRFPAMWLTWWLGDAVGALIVTPFLVLWLRGLPPSAGWPDQVQRGVILGGMALLGWAAFLAVFPNTQTLPITFLCLPALVLIAFRSGPHDTAAAALLLALLATGGTVAHTGAFGSEREPTALILLHLFLATTSVTAMALAVVVADRECTAAALRRSQDELERRVAERTTELARTNESLRQHIRERDLAAEQLRQAERLAAVGQMISGMAHECRNALQRSRACLDMLGLEVRGQPRALDLLARTRRAQDHLQRLFEEVRQYAAPIVLDRAPCDLRELLHQAWRSLDEARKGRTFHLVESPDAIDRCCVVDRQAIERVFRNILENALAACPDPGHIEVTWREDDLDGHAALQIVICDNGPGLDAEQRRGIFEPFFTTKTRGTGLGMAIARRLIEAHGGRIAVGECQSGAEIMVCLPRGM